MKRGKLIALNILLEAALIGMEFGFIRGAADVVNFIRSGEIPEYSMYRNSPKTETGESPPSVKFPKDRKWRW